MPDPPSDGAVFSSIAAQTVSALLGANLTPDETEEILAATNPVTARPKQVVIKQGDEGRGLFFLLEGRAEILQRDREGTEQRIASVEAPTVLGELSLLTDGRHSATVRAVTGLELRLLTRERFEELRCADRAAAHKLVYTIARVVARRLVDLGDRMVTVLNRRDLAEAEKVATFWRTIISAWPL